jgi:hypothetical protein
MAGRVTAGATSRRSWNTCNRSRYSARKRAAVERSTGGTASGMTVSEKSGDAQNFASASDT